MSTSTWVISAPEHEFPPLQGWSWWVWAHTLLCIVHWCVWVRTAPSRQHWESNHPRHRQISDPNLSLAGFKGLVLKQLCRSWKTNTSRHDSRVTPCFLPQQLPVWTHTGSESQNPAGTFSPFKSICLLHVLAARKTFLPEPSSLHKSSRGVSAAGQAQENPLDKPCLLPGAVLNTAVNLGVFFSENFLYECSRVTHRGSLSHTLSRWAVPSPSAPSAPPNFQIQPQQTQQSKKSTSLSSPRAQPPFLQGWCLCPITCSVSQHSPRALHSALDTEPPLPAQHFFILALGLFPKQGYSRLD